MFGGERRPFQFVLVCATGVARRLAQGGSAVAATPSSPGAAAEPAAGEAATLLNSSGARRECGRSGSSNSLGPLQQPQQPPQLLPVFRSSPYAAEAARRRAQSPTARILFLDDGGACRAVLAQAVLQSMLRCGGGGGVKTSSLAPPAPSVWHRLSACLPALTQQGQPGAGRGRGVRLHRAAGAGGP